MVKGLVQQQYRRGRTSPKSSDEQILVMLYFQQEYSRAAGSSSLSISSVYTYTHPRVSGKKRLVLGPRGIMVDGSYRGVGYVRDNDAVTCIY